MDFGVNGLPSSKPPLGFLKYKHSGIPKNKERLNVGKSNKAQFDIQKASALEETFIHKGYGTDLPLSSRLVGQRFYSDAGTSEMMRTRRKVANALRLALEWGGRGVEEAREDRVGRANAIVPPPTPPPPPTKCVSAATSNVNAVEIHPCVNYLERQNRHGKGHQISVENHFLASPTPKYPPFTMNAGREMDSLVTGKHGNASVAMQPPFIIPDAYVQERQACGGGMLEYNDPVRDKYSHISHIVRFNIAAQKTATQQEEPQGHSYTTSRTSNLSIIHGSAESANSTHTEEDTCCGLAQQSCPHRTREDDRAHKGKEEKKERELKDGEKEKYDRQGKALDSGKVEEGGHESMTDVLSTCSVSVEGICPFCFPAGEEKGKNVENKNFPMKGSAISTYTSTRKEKDNMISHSERVRMKVQKAHEEDKDGGNRDVWTPASLPSTSALVSSDPLPNCPFGCCCFSVPEDYSIGSPNTSCPTKSSAIEVSGSDDNGSSSILNGEKHRNTTLTAWGDGTCSRCTSFCNSPQAPLPSHISPTTTHSNRGSSSGISRSTSTTNTRANNNRNSNYSINQGEGSTISSDTRSNLGGRHHLFRHVEDLAFIPPQYTYPKGHAGDEYKDTLVPPEKWIISYTPSAKPWQVSPFIGRCGYKDKSLTFDIIQAKPSSALYPTPAEQYSSVAHSPLLTPCAQQVPRRGVRRVFP